MSQRTKINYLALFCLIITLFCGCNNSPKNKTSYAHEEKVIQAYLEELGAKKNLDSIDYIVIIPCSACLSCGNYALSKLPPLVSQKQKNCLFLVGNHIKLAQDFNFEHLSFFRDKNCLISDYKIILQSVNIFKITEGHIKDIFMCHAQGLKSIENYPFS
ncbi:MAG: hypothetical protein ACEPOW_04375 [Bacteroidales bacterium]